MSAKKINFELLDYFVNFLQENTNKAEGTISNISRDLRCFINYLDDNNYDICEESIQAYLQVLEDKYTESSFITKASSLRQFINWLNLEENPFWKIRISISLEDYKYYEKEELVDKFSQDDYPTLIARTLYELYLATEELSQLKLSDYNGAGHFFRLRERKIKVSDTLAQSLKTYVKQIRPSLIGIGFTPTSTDPIFLKPIEANPALEQINTNDILKMLHEKNLKNSYLKRSRIIHLIDDGKNANDIEKILGIKISDFYRPFFKEKSYRLLSAYNEFHPRAKASS